MSVCPQCWGQLTQRPADNPTQRARSEPVPRYDGIQYQVSDRLPGRSAGFLIGCRDRGDGVVG